MADVGSVAMERRMPLDEPVEEIRRVSQELASIEDTTTLMAGLFAHAPVALAVVAPDGQVRLVNRAFRELFGSVPPPDYRMTADDVAARLGILDMLRRSLRGETVRTPTVWYDPRELRSVPVLEGKRVAISMTSFPLFDRTGKIQYVVATFRDDTAEVQAIERLRVSEANYREIFEKAGEAIFVLDPETNCIVDMNAQAVGDSGYTLEAIQGVPPAAVVSGEPGYSAADLARWSRLAMSEGPQVFESRVRTRDGTVLWVEVKLHRTVIAGRTRLLAFVRPADERKRLETALKEANEHLEQRLDELARSNLELQEFAYVASHDLQTPLRTISSFVRLLQTTYRGKLDEQADDWIGRTIQSAERLQAVIQGLLDYSRAGAQGKVFEPVDMSEVFRDTIADLEALIRETGAAVTCSPLPIVVGSRPQLVQLLENLVGNAVKFHREVPPRVDVSAAERGEEWIFTVADNGIGIDPKHQHRLFGIFRRVHGEQRFPGTGIGLAVCRRIVERHGGRIWVESEAGVGSTFAFSIPCRRAPERAHSSPPAKRG
jgi:PAS domain S-box-containing protein